MRYTSFSFIFYLILPLCITQYLSPEESISLKYVTDKTAIPFYVSAVHYDWCLNHEGQQVQEFSDILVKKKNECFVVDVGMNDGFYTNMAGAYGCQVYSFELQRRCIEASKLALRKNNALDKVNIFHNPVTSVNGEELTIQFPVKDYCDGGFTMTGEDKAARSHVKAPLLRSHNFTTVSLDAIIPKTLMIDILKVDVEGHELAVLDGAMHLFRRKQIKRAFVELGNIKFYGGPDNVIRVYKEIMSYGYKLVVANCPTYYYRGVNNPEVFTIDDLDRFKTYLGYELYSQWNCPDLYIQEN